MAYFNERMVCAYASNGESNITPKPLSLTAIVVLLLPVNALGKSLLNCDIAQSASNPFFDIFSVSGKYFPSNAGLVQLEEKCMEIANTTLNEALLGVTNGQIEIAKEVLQNVYDNLK